MQKIVTASGTPLLSRNNDDLIAVVDQTELTAQDFEQQIAALGQALPNLPFAINLCQHRIHFQRSMLSVIWAGQCNLLPPNKQSATVKQILAKYPNSYIIADNDSLEDFGVPHLNAATAITKIASEAIEGQATPSLDTAKPIPDTQLAAISFTSGTTGESKPNIKTWAMLRHGNAINIENMLESASKRVNLLATVPPQHMYGLELSVLLPMAANVTVFSGQPLFPADVLAALQAMPSPRILVSTPQHLRALTKSQLPFPTVERIFSATAPLDHALAKQTEDTFGGKLVEIYGCSEVGSIARRKSVQEAHWTPFSAMQLTIENGQASVYAEHVGSAITLQDVIQQEPNGTFSLQGRLADLVNIAGKRSSLAQINKQLLSIDVVQDGIVFLPDDASDQHQSSRLAAIVIAKSESKKQIIDSLRKQLDPVFLPRPLLFTDHLPRNETGKITRKELLALFDQLRNKSVD